MKKLVALMLAATVLAAPMSQARDGHRHSDRSRHVERQVQVEKKSWSSSTGGTGATGSPPPNAAERRHLRDVRDYHRYRLSEPPRGYRWVKVDNDFLLIGITCGIISSIIAAR